MMMKKNKMKVKIMSKSNVKSLNALSVKLGKDSDAFNKVGALKNIYAALSGKESKGITVSDVIDEITTVAENRLHLANWCGIKGPFQILEMR